MDNVRYIPPLTSREIGEMMAKRRDELIRSGEVGRDSLARDREPFVYIDGEYVPILHVSAREFAEESLKDI